MMGMSTSNSRSSNFKLWPWPWTSKSSIQGSTTKCDMCNHRCIVHGTCISRPICCLRPIVICSKCSRKYNGRHIDVLTKFYRLNNSNLCDHIINKVAEVDYALAS